MKIWEPKPSGTLWATPGLLRDTFTFYTSYNPDVIILFVQFYSVSIPYIYRLSQTVILGKHYIINRFKVIIMPLLIIIIIN